MTASARGERNRVLPALQVGAGFVVLLVGIILALPFIPGPGIAVILLGLFMLKNRFGWADRTLTRIKAFIERVLRRRQRP